MKRCLKCSTTNFLLLEFGPFLLVLDHETFESIWITHPDDDVTINVFATFLLSLQFLSWS